MSSSTSSSEAEAPAAKKTSAPMFLAAMLGGAVLIVAGFSFAPESWIHKAPEFGMAEALEDHIEQACRDRIAPELLIIGDSRAVAGVSVEMVRAAGIDAEKFALGGAGIFAGWATLDRLIDCGVKPKTVVMAYGTGHMIEGGAIMDRTTNYDVLKGSRAGHAYAMASEWEDRRARKLAYKAASIVGTEVTGIDFVLMRPALRNVLEGPPRGVDNYIVNEQERAGFLASGGDRYYGQAEETKELPGEAEFEGDSLPGINFHATRAIAELGAAHGFSVLFYTLPVSNYAREGLRPEVFELSEAFLASLKDFDVTALNGIWSLPDNNFGDPSHVNARGRAKVTADFLKRLGDRRSMAGDAIHEAGPGAG